MSTREVNFLSAVRSEIERARAKFPDQARYKLVIAAGEEFGEVSEAFLSLDGEGHKGHTEQSLYNECVQLAATAMRIAIDCPKQGHSPGND